MSKSGQKKAVGKQFSYEMETEETRKGLEKGSTDPEKANGRNGRNLWQVDQLKEMNSNNCSTKVKSQSAHSGSTQTRTYTWKGLANHTLWNTSQDRGDQEKPLGIKTDSGPADLDSIKMILSWAASEKLKMSLDITNANFHGETMTRLFLLFFGSVFKDKKSLSCPFSVHVHTWSFIPGIMSSFVSSAVECHFCDSGLR